MAKLDKSEPQGVVASVFALLHKLPPGSLIVVAVAGLLGYLHVRGMEHGTASAEKLAAAIERQAAVQEAIRADQLDYYKQVLANQLKLIDGVKGMK